MYVSKRGFGGLMELVAVFLGLFLALLEIF
jgi:hypothetical protein